MRLRHPAITLTTTATLLATATLLTAATATATTLPPKTATSRTDMPKTATPNTATSSRTKTWQPYRTQPFLDHGVCPFDVRGIAVYDKELFTTLATFPDGSPRRQEYKGPLYIRYTNVATGRSIVRNQSGKAWLDVKPDKTQVWRVYDGHFGAAVKAGTNGYPAGEWLFHGDFTLTFTAAGSIGVKLIHATATNLCRALA
jgi:hypothetical protein